MIVKKQLKKCKKEIKKVMCDNLDDEEKEHWKKEDTKKKERKEKRDNLDDNERDQMKNKDNKRKKETLITSVIMKKNS